MPTLSTPAASKHPDLAFVNARMATRTYTGPASYSTGGDAIAARDLKLSHLLDVLPAIARNSAGTIRLLYYNRADGTIRWYDDAFTEIAATTDLSGFTATIWAIEG